MNLDSLNFYDKKQFRRLLGIYVREQRLSRRISQKTLSDRIGVHSSVIANIENGTRKLTQELFADLIEALSLDEAKIFDLSKITEAQYLLEIYRLNDVETA
jgi:transcriptional regulator with XRE-family HTH domain